MVAATGETLETGAFVAMGWPLQPANRSALDKNKLDNFFRTYVPLKQTGYMMIS
jgi:hypothetical protein